MKRLLPKVSITVRYISFTMNKDGTSIQREVEKRNREVTNEDETDEKE